MRLSPAGKINSIGLVALSVKGPMGQYLHCLARALGDRRRVHVFIPEHYVWPGQGYTITRFRTGRTQGRALAKLLNPFGARALWRSLQAQRPDLIHLFNGEGYPWAPLLMHWARQAGVPTVVTVHDPEPHPGSLIGRINAAVRFPVLRWASGIHVHNQFGAERLEKFLARSPSVAIIPHGNLFALFRPHLRENIAREPLVLFFGRFEYYKGIDLLLDAVPLLSPEIKVLLAGPGKVRRDVRVRLQRVGSRVELINRYLAENEVAALFQRASVCVMPYRQCTQSSLPVLSASFGVPLVGTKVGGLREDVPKVHGILVAPNDPAALAEGIARGIGITPVVPSDYEFEVIADKFCAFYQATGEGCR